MKHGVIVPMIVISGTARLRPEARADALAAATEMARLSRAEAGCRAYEFSVTLEDPDTIRLFEVWEDDASLQRHFATPHLAKFSGQLGGFLAGPPDFLRYEVSSTGPIRPAAG